MQRNPIWSLLITVLVLVALWYILGGIWQLLKWGAPFMAILALIISFTTVKNHVLWQLKQLTVSPLSGTLLLVASVLLYPLTAAYLFTKALMSRFAYSLQKNIEARIKKYENEAYTEFEEIKDPSFTQTHKHRQTEDRRHDDRFV